MDSFRNPSPPPEGHEGVEDPGNHVLHTLILLLQDITTLTNSRQSGQTKAATEYSKEEEEEESSKQNDLQEDQEGDSEVVKRLCILWDLTTEEDFKEALSKLQIPTMELLGLLLLNRPRGEDHNRAVEVIVGIMANLIPIKGFEGLVSERCSVISEMFVSSANPEVLIQLLRFMSAAASQSSKVSPNPALTDALGAPFQEKLVFIMGNSLVQDLFQQAAYFAHCAIWYLPGLLTDETLEGIVAALVEILGSQTRERQVPEEGFFVLEKLTLAGHSSIQPQILFSTANYLLLNAQDHWDTLSLPAALVCHWCLMFKSSVPEEIERVCTDVLSSRWTLELALGCLDDLEEDLFVLPWLNFLELVVKAAVEEDQKKLLRQALCNTIELLVSSLGRVEDPVRAKQMVASLEKILAEPQDPETEDCIKQLHRVLF